MFFTLIVVTFVFIVFEFELSEIIRVSNCKEPQTGVAALLTKGLVEVLRWRSLPNPHASILEFFNKNI